MIVYANEELNGKRANRAPRTWSEWNFADEDPSGGKVQPQLDELADAVVQLDADVARILEDAVLQRSVNDRFTRINLAADAEMHVHFVENL